MIDPASLATAAIALVAPHLIELSKEFGKGAASGAGKSAWDWIKAKLTSPAGQEAVADLEKNPNESVNIKAFEAALTKFLSKNPSIAAEFENIINKSGVSFASQNASVVGDNNKVGQASGGSTVTIS